MPEITQSAKLREPRERTALARVGTPVSTAIDIAATDGLLLRGQVCEPQRRLKIELFWRAMLPIAARLYDPVPKWVVREVLPRGVELTREPSASIKNELTGRTPKHETGVRARSDDRCALR